MQLGEPTSNGRRTDGQLIEQIAGGDREAFEELYGRYARAVLGLALRRLGDRGRAEDAVQETFASVWRAAGSYKPERGPARGRARPAARRPARACAGARP